MGCLCGFPFRGDFLRRRKKYPRKRNSQEKKTCQAPIRPYHLNNLSHTQLTDRLTMVELLGL